MADSGRRPPAGSVSVIRVYESGDWSYEHRPSVPILGIFLVALGALLLIDQLAPGSISLTFDGIVLALGLAFLVSWWRGGWGLYPGLLLVALSLPGVLIELQLIPDRDGYSTLLLGVGLLAVAIARVRDRRGIGWQGFLGTILLVLGGASVFAIEGAGALVIPALLIALGGLIILRR